MKKAIENLYNLQTIEAQSRKSNEQQIQTLRVGLPPQMLAHYDRLRVRGKKGVAVVRNGVCSGCHLRVAIGVYNSLVLGDTAIACGNCGAYLYLPKEEPVAQAKPSSSTKAKRVAAAA